MHTTIPPPLTALLAALPHANGGTRLNNAAVAHLETTLADCWPTVTHADIGAQLRALLAMEVIGGNTRILYDVQVPVLAATLTALAADAATVLRLRVLPRQRYARAG